MSGVRIEINAEVMLGKPVIRGTRVTVELLLRKLSEGASEDDLLDAYPRITREDVRAAVRFAADTVANDETISDSCHTRSGPLSADARMMPSR